MVLKESESGERMGSAKKNRRKDKQTRREVHLLCSRLADDEEFVKATLRMSEEMMEADSVVAFSANWLARLTPMVERLVDEAGIEPDPLSMPEDRIVYMVSSLEAGTTWIVSIGSTDDWIIMSKPHGGPDRSVHWLAAGRQTRAELGIPADQLYLGGS
jgi:hypothetical protein